MNKLVRFDWAIKFLLRNKANFDILEGFVLRLDEKNRREYEYYQEMLHYDASMALPYEIGRDEGRKEGLIEGRMMGLYEGHGEGFTEGRAEGLKEAQFKFASSLKQAGFTFAEIIKFTQLSEKELEAIVIKNFT